MNTVQHHMHHLWCEHCRCKHHTHCLQECAFGAQAVQQSALGVVPHVSLLATSLDTVIAQRATLGSGTQCGDTACHAFLAEPFYRVSETLPPWTHLRC